MIKRHGFHLSHLFVGLALFARPAAPPSYEAEPVVPPSFDVVMDAAKPRNPCSVSGVEDLCHGLPPSELWVNFNNGDTSAARQLATWAQHLVFTKPKAGVARRPDQTLGIAQIDDVERVWLKSFASLPAQNQAVFLMQLTADPTRVPDDDYGAGRPRNPYGIPSTVFEKFYIVFDGWAPDKNTFRHESYKVGTFSVYGIRRFKHISGQLDAPELVQIGKSKGKFRICAAHHADEIKNEGAQFLSCDAVSRFSDLIRRYPPLVTALAGRSLYDAVVPIESGRNGARSPDANVRRQVIQTSLDRFIATYRLDRGMQPEALRILVEVNDNPAWEPCGVGCCTADDK